MYILEPMYMKRGRASGRPQSDKELHNGFNPRGKRFDGLH